MDRRKRRRLELTTDPSSLRSNFAHRGYESSSQLSLDLNWSDLLTFAKGAEHLTIVVRNEDREIEAQYEIDTAPIVAVEQEIQDAIATLQEIEADYRTSCKYRDDLYPIIVVT